MQIRCGLIFMQTKIFSVGRYTVATCKPQKSQDRGLALVRNDRQGQYSSVPIASLWCVRCTNMQMHFALTSKDKRLFHEFQLLIFNCFFYVCLYKYSFSVLCLLISIFVLQILMNKVPCKQFVYFQRAAYQKSLSKLYIQSLKTPKVKISL